MIATAGPPVITMVIRTSSIPSLAWFERCLPSFRPEDLAYETCRRHERGRARFNLAVSIHREGAQKHAVDRDLHDAQTETRSREVSMRTVTALLEATMPPSGRLPIGRREERSPGLKLGDLGIVLPARTDL
jgi:hypothetical protein